MAPPLIPPSEHAVRTKAVNRFAKTIRVVTLDDPAALCLDILGFWKKWI